MSNVHYPLHDEVNLVRLVRRLEKAPEEKWDESQRLPTWIKAQGIVQKVKFARKLLMNVELSEEDQTPERIQRLDKIRIKLDTVESFAKGVTERTTPLHRRPPPVPRPPTSLPLDLPTVGLVTSPEGESAPVPDDLLLPADTPAFPSATSFVLPSPMTLIPSSIPATATASTAVATGVLQHSSALQQELSDQLAQMASQLKRNALHFSDTLVRDQAVVEETKGKLESNFDIMTKERLRLRDHRGKSGSTTCLVVMIIVTVLLLFVFMVSIIRFT